MAYYCILSVNPSGMVHSISIVAANIPHIGNIKENAFIGLPGNLMFFCHFHFLFLIRLDIVSSAKLRVIPACDNEK